MSEVKNFELGAILTITTGYSCVEDFSKVFELVGFVCNDNTINTLGLGMVKEDVKKHLLTIHPELQDIRYQKGTNINKFITKQEKKFGSFLPVTQLGINLPEKYNKKKKDRLNV